ncbi:MAG: OadG family protein [bacterium]|nr:OadG family protein [bacterium]
MITCIFGLTACGEGKTLTDYEQQKVTMAEQMASQAIVPLFADYLCDDVWIRSTYGGTGLDEFTAEEVSYLCEQTFGIQADGYTLLSGVESFRSALETIGGITGTGSVSAKISDKQIIVEVEVIGADKRADAEIIFSNDMFLLLESASLNPRASMGELMGKAALNTLIGMGTVFAVLILISLIISCFSFIPKLQKALSGKKAETDEAEKAGIDNAVAQIAAQEEEPEESDDLELAAVIAAAVAAYEGTASTDGFVVRSIRRRA